MYMEGMRKIASSRIADVRPEIGTRYPRNTKHKWQPQRGDIQLNILWFYYDVFVMDGS
jgi:hypothetical protein